MSIFEFVLVMTSLVLAIGITHLLQHVAVIVRHRQTLEISWVPLLWMVCLFLSSANYWWALWDYRGLEWTFPSFFFLLIPPTLLYVIISLLVSADITNPHASLATSFEQIRVPFFSVLIVYQILLTWDGWVLGVEPVWNTMRMVGLIVILVYAVGAVVAKSWVQKVVTASVFVMFVFGMFVLRFMPGAFGPP
jgi:hypothetical protein